MAKQTRLATTLTARYFPTSELTDAFYMDGRVTSKTTARSADLTNDKEDRGFFFSVFSHQTIADQDPNALPPYEPVLRRLGTELKSGRRSLDDQIGEMVNTAVSITGRMKIQSDASRAPFFAGVMVKDAEAFAITMGKGLAFLYRDDTLYPMTATDIRIDAINTARQKVDNFYNFCATKTAPALCSNIAQLKLDDCIILCNREVYEALGQQELLRILYDAEDQSDAASVVITEAAAKLPGVPLQFMISFVEDITSSDRGGFFGFGRKKKKVVEEDVDDYNVAPPVPLESPETPAAPAPKDAMLFGDAEPEKETAPDVSPMGETGEVPVLSSTPVNGDTSIVPIPAGTAADAIASMTGAATASTAATASSVEEAIATPIPEPPLAFGDLSELMGETKKPEVKEEAKVEEDLGETKVVPFVNTFDKAADALDKQLAENEKKDIEDKKALENTAETAIDKILEAIPEETPAVPVVPEAREVVPAAPSAPSDEPFVAVKNADNPFFKAAQKAQAEEAGTAASNLSFEIGGEDDKPQDANAPLFIGDEAFGGVTVPDNTNTENQAGTEQSTDEGKTDSAAAAETDEDAPLVFEADDEGDKPMNDEPEYSNDPKEFDETPLFFGDAESASEEHYEPAGEQPVESEETPSSADEFVIPFASNDAPSTASATANDIPEMPLYEAPSYTPPTYPTNSDTPVGYEDTGVYARGSYTVDEDESTPVSPYVAPAATPVSPFVNEAPSAEVPEVSQFVSAPAPSSPFVAESGDTSSFVSDAAADVSAAGSEDISSENAAADISSQYNLNNPPPAVADLFDVDPNDSMAVTSQATQAAASAAEPSAVPPYMAQSGAVRPGSVPGVPKRSPQGYNQRPGNRPNTQPAKRRVDAIDDGFDDDEAPGTSYLPYVLAAVSVICLIIIIVLIAKSCSDGKSKKETDASSDPSITALTDETGEVTGDVSGDVSGETSAETTPETTPEATSATDPIGVYTFSDNSGCRTWWDLFYHVYGIKIESESDSRVTTILTYNGLDASYTPKAGDEIKLPPVSMINA